MDFPPHPFWDFALDVYRRPGVSDACLQLQEDQHVDVNLLLFLCWIGASDRGQLSPAEVALCMDAVQPWHDSIVRPLRGVRQRLKEEMRGAPADLTQALRREIQAREIDAEHIEQLILTATLARHPGDGATPVQRLENAAQNVLIYLRALGARIGAAEQSNLAVVLQAVFPGVAPQNVQATLTVLAGSTP